MAWFRTAKRKNQALIFFGQKLIIQGKEKAIHTPHCTMVPIKFAHKYVAGAHLTPGMTWKQVEGSSGQGPGGVGNWHAPLRSGWPRRRFFRQRVYGRHRHTFGHLQHSTRLRGGRGGRAVQWWFLRFFPLWRPAFFSAPTARGSESASRPTRRRVMSARENPPADRRIDSQHRSHRGLVWSPSPVGGGDRAGRQPGQAQAQAQAQLGRSLARWPWLLWLPPCHFLS